MDGLQGLPQSAVLAPRSTPHPPNLSDLYFPPSSLHLSVTDQRPPHLARSFSTALAVSRHGTLLYI